MRHTRPLTRALIVAAIAVSVLGATGCKWFRKGSELYAQSPESRPLEVPPDLDRPDTSSAMPVPSSGTTSVTRSGMAAPAAAPQASNGFTVAAPRDEVFGRIEPVLAEAILPSYLVRYRPQGQFTKIDRTA